jgi:hypothetical protein
MERVHSFQWRLELEDAHQPPLQACMVVWVPLGEGPSAIAASSCSISLVLAPLHACLIRFICFMKAVYVHGAG